MQRNITDILERVTFILLALVLLRSRPRMHLAGDGHEIPPL